MSTNPGYHLLNPGDDPASSAQCLLFLTAMIKAVDMHADLLRISTASAGNDHRLGACEAPPAIISIFLGEQLTDIMDQIEAGTVTSTRKSGFLKVGVETLPPLPLDATDRNRTSPFAFTGNKFEFRAPGSSQSCGEVNTLLNAIVAESIEVMADRIEAFDESQDFNTQLQATLQRILKKHKKVIFNGNGYNAEWIEEAHRRGLPELNDTVLAIRKLLDPKNIELLEKTGVFSKAEIHSRCEIFEEEYKRKVRIEAELALLMVRTMIQPAAVEEYASLSGAVNGNADKPGYKAVKRSLERIGDLMDQLSDETEELETLLNEEAEAADAE
jgi:glutamine synthetase